MNQDEMMDLFYKNVEFLHKTIPPDDIYIYAEQTYIAALFFMFKLKKFVDFEEEMQKDTVLAKYASNLMLMLEAKEKNLNCYFDFGLDKIEET